MALLVLTSEKKKNKKTQLPKIAANVMLETK